MIVIVLISKLSHQSNVSTIRCPLNDTVHLDDTHFVLTWLIKLRRPEKPEIPDIPQCLAFIISDTTSSEYAKTS
jgi:hypothetical protein